MLLREAEPLDSSYNPELSEFVQFQVAECFPGTDHCDVCKRQENISAKPSSRGGAPPTRGKDTLQTATHTPLYSWEGVWDGPIAKKDANSHITVTHTRAHIHLGIGFILYSL